MSTLAIGQTVRYGRTGTVGKIVALTEENGSAFAELDSTGLYYRIDQLTAISDVVHKETENRDFRKDLEQEQEKFREMNESAWQNTDQSCEGGG
ncbi:hypothetical protein McpSp1_07960 [Methanocorpusculaceae archaeon Sp1]|uniref:DUF2098 domain-containing protein n=1 Tax=Methanorbis furvi TaxID=3028299 RepID=A0AAE4MEJ8_9EURY|nr:hypothetical protein [Methanocorpusculaceae archaeon Sp1]MDV0442078.1 hypothetical protein [Methanocorpusculaceae archaeon Ag1]